MTDRSAIELYKTQTRDLLAQRARGSLSQDDEAEIAGQLHDTWEALSLEEREEIEKWLVSPSQITRGDASALRYALTMALDLASDVGDDEILSAVTRARTSQVQLRDELEVLVCMHERDWNACQRTIKQTKGPTIRVFNESAARVHKIVSAQLRRLLEILT